MSEQIRTTQQLANAAEAFVSTLGSLFPGDTFDQFFHGDTVRHAYWAALQETLDRYATPENAPLAQALMNGQVLSEPPVVGEFLKLFLPGQQPDYGAVAGQWAAVLPSGELATLQREAQVFFALLADELRQSPDLRLALEQLAQARYPQQVAARVDEDLNRLLEAALVSGPNALGRQVQHILSLAEGRAPGRDVGSVGLVALAQIADQLEAPVLRAIVGRLSSVSDSNLRLRIMGLIAPYVSRLENTPDPLTMVQSMLNRSSSALNPVVVVEVLLALVPHLDSPTRDYALPSFQQRVLAGAQSVEDAASRVRALGALIEKLPPHLQPEAVAMAFETATCCIPSELARATALSVLPPHLPPEFHERLLRFATQLSDPDARALLLGRMIPYLPPTFQVKALSEALEAISAINGDDARARALIALAPYIDAVGPLQHVPEGLQQVITVTFSIARQDERARAFAALAPYLSPELLSEALQAVKGILDDDDRAATLSKLAPHLPDDLCVAAYAIAQEITRFEARALALSAIAPYLSSSARAKALQDALAAALAVERRYDRVVALVDLAPHLPDELRSRALREALTATRSIPDEGERSRALIFLAPHLTRDWLADALADAYTLLDPAERVPVLSALMPYLPAKPQNRVGQDVIKLAQAARHPHDKASFLAAIAPVLPDHLIDHAARIAQQIDTPYDQMHVLGALLPRQPERLHDIALAAAHAVPDRYQRVNALLELVPHAKPALRYPILDEALNTALEVEDDYDRASALAHLAPYVDMQGETQNRQQDALALALEACFRVTNTHTRAALLERIAQVWVRLLVPAQAYTLWRQVVSYLRRQPYADAVSDLAALVPVMAHIGGMGAVEDLAARLRKDVLSQ